MVFLDVDGQHLVRLALLAIDLAEHHARAAHRQLIALAAHVLEQDGEVQLAAAADQEAVGLAGVLDTQRHVLQQLAVESLADLAAGHELALAAGQRAIVDLEGHGQRGLVDGDRRQRVDVLRVAQSHADVDLLDAGDQDDVAGQRLLGWHAFEAVELEHLPDLGAAAALVAIHHGQRLVGADAAALDATDADLANVGRVVERADLQLQRPVLVDLGRRHVTDDRLVQGGHVGAGLGRVEHGVAVQRAGVDHREIQLLLGGAEFVEQIKGVVDHPVRARTRAVDLVDHDDRLEPQRQCLARDEAGLRHRTLDRIDQQQHAVDHRQHALDLAAEVGVARGVDDVDVGVAPADGAVLGKDGDAALFFEVVAVHHPLCHLLVLAERARLPQQLVDQGGLAVVDVGDDGDVADGAGHERP